MTRTDQSMRSLRQFLIILSSVLVFTAATHAEAPREPKMGSAERKAIMEAMRPAVSQYVGKRVTFTGEVKIVDTWATFSGGVAPSDGKKPKNEDVAFELELDFFALLRLVDGKWVLLHWGFAGDVGVLQEARQKFPKAPLSLVPHIPDP